MGWVEPRWGCLSEHSLEDKCLKPSLDNPKILHQKKYLPSMPYGVQADIYLEPADRKDDTQL